MNDRIKELAEQADCSIDGMGYGEGDIEALAKLIVIECAKLSKQAIKHAHDVAVSNHALPDYVMDKIKRHFGIEK